MHTPTGTHLRVDNEVQVALPVALFFVGEAFELVWKRQQRFGEHRPFLHVHRELAFFGALRTAIVVVGAPQIGIE